MSGRQVLSLCIIIFPAVGEEIYCSHFSFLPSLLIYRGNSSTQAAQYSAPSQCGGSIAKGHLPQQKQENSIRYTNLSFSCWNFPGIMPAVGIMGRWAMCCCCRFNTTNLGNRCKLGLELPSLLPPSAKNPPHWVTENSSASSGSQIRLIAPGSVN